MNRKRSRILSLLLLLILCSSGLQPESANQVVAFGVVRYQGQKLGGVSVKVYQDDQLITKMVTTPSRGYGFQLDYNTQYRIEFSKIGFLKQQVLINTQVTNEVLSYGDRLLWEPDFNLIRTIPGLNTTEIPEPVACYHFDEEYWGFVENPEYQLQMAPKLRALHDTLARFQKRIFLTEQNRGDSLLNEKQYPEAILAYNRASEYQPNDTELRKKIKSAEKLLKGQSSADESYQEAIEKADTYMAQQNYNDAGSYYQKSLLYQPDASYPANKLYEIDSIQSYAWIKQNDAYESLLAKGDSLLQHKQYEPARNNFWKAASIFPEEAYPKKQLVFLDSLLKLDGNGYQELHLVETTADPHSNSKSKDSVRVQASASTTLRVQETLPGTQPAMQTVKDTTLPVHTIPAVEQKTEFLAEILDSASIKTTIPASPIPLKETTDETLHSSNRQEPVMTEEEIPLETIARLQKKLAVVRKEGNPKAEAGIYDEMGRLYQSEYQLNKALEAYKASLKIKQHVGDKTGEVQVLSNIASVLYDSGQYQAAVAGFEQSLDMAQALDDKPQSANIMESIAMVYEHTYRYDEALQKLQESLVIKEQLGDETAVSAVHESMGSIYYEQNQYDQAIAALEKAARIEARIENKNDLSATYNSLGAAYFQKNDLKQSAGYYEKSLNYARETNNKKLQALSLNNLGNLNFSSEKFQKAIEYYQQSLHLKQEIAFQEGIAATLHNIGNSFYSMKQYGKALEYYSASQDIALKTNQYEIQWRNYRAFAKTYAAQGKFKMAYENYEQYATSKFDEYGQSGQLIELREDYESSKLAVRSLKRELQKQSRIARYEAERNRREMQIVELEIANKQQQLKKQRYVIISFVFGSFLVLAFALIVTRLFRLTRRAYRIVAKQKQDITQGISYAARIQSAVLPPMQLVRSLLPEHFILYKPCEVVSGDFYWVGQHFGKTVVAISDCTGHGVPGGFMSMLGVALLNEIMTSEQPLESHDILTQLRDRVVEALHQKGGDSESLDGMDISLLLFDPQSREIQFSAAYHSLYIISRGEMRKIKGDRMPIGFHFKTKDFTSEKQQLLPGDVLYMTTDGYPDQIGHKEQRRLMLAPFRDMLLEIHQHPMDKQLDILNTTIEGWRGHLPQTDDMLVMGIRV